MEFLDQPMLRAIWPALLAALVLAGLFGRVGGIRAAGIAVPVGFLVSAWVLVGLPEWPPASAQGRMLYSVAVLGLLGFVFDLLRLDGAALRSMIALALAAALVWVAFPVVQRLDWFDMGIVFLIAILAASLLPTLQGGAEAGPEAAAVLAVLSVGVAALAILGGSASTAEMAGALAAGFLGWALWCWPRPRFAPGAAFLMGGGGAVALLVASFVLFGSGEAWAFLVLPFSFAAPRFARALPLPRGAVGQALLPILVALIAAIPALAAIGIASLTDRGGYGY